VFQQAGDVSAAGGPFDKGAPGEGEEADHQAALFQSARRPPCRPGDNPGMEASYPPPTPLRNAAAALAPALSAPERLLGAFLSGRSPRTLRAYALDLADFARWSGVASAAEAARLLLAAGQGGAKGTALAYRAGLLARGLSAATVNRRLAALRSLVKVARLLGLAGWTLDVEGVPSEPLRDSRGPGAAGVRALLAVLALRPAGPAWARDTALVRLLFDLGLRRAEAVGLDLADVDLAGGCVWVKGKGRSERARLTLPGPTRVALEAWLAERGAAPGALFHRLDRGGRGKGRLTGAAVYNVVRRLGEAAGLRARPHGLRHAAITAALDATNGDVRAVQKFSRHRDVRVLQRYDDNRQDLAGGVASRIAGGL
jgi:integrase/recombinase XerC